MIALLKRGGDRGDGGKGFCASPTLLASLYDTLDGGEAQEGGADFLRVSFGLFAKFFQRRGVEGAL